jgi:hypothetical protein
MLSTRSGSGTLALIPALVTYSPSPQTLLAASDISGNTALHHASAAGELKALRMLLQYGANPLASNAYSWTPVHYSATAAAEVYFKTLIIEFEKKKAEGKREAKERERQRTAGVRLVIEDSDAADGNNSGRASAATVGRGSLDRGRGLADRGISEGVSERQRARDDAALAGLPGPGMAGSGMDWSPVTEKRRAMTPTEGRGWTYTVDGMRKRAETGESI